MRYYKLIDCTCLCVVYMCWKNKTKIKQGASRCLFTNVYICGGQWLTIPSSTAFLFWWDMVSQWSPNSLLQVDWLTSKSLRSACLCLPGAGATGDTAMPGFQMMLGTWTKVVKYFTCFQSPMLICLFGMVWKCPSKCICCKLNPYCNHVKR